MPNKWMQKLPNGKNGKHIGGGFFPVKVHQKLISFVDHIFKKTVNFTKVFVD